MVTVPWLGLLIMLPWLVEVSYFVLAMLSSYITMVTLASLAWISMVIFPDQVTRQCCHGYVTFLGCHCNLTVAGESCLTLTGLPKNIAMMILPWPGCRGALPCWSYLDRVAGEYFLGYLTLTGLLGSVAMMILPWPGCRGALPWWSLPWPGCRGA